jgi:hypothetical protein
MAHKKYRAVLARPPVPDTHSALCTRADRAPVPGDVSGRYSQRTVHTGRPVPGDVMHSAQCTLARAPAGRVGPILTAHSAHGPTVHPCQERNAHGTPSQRTVHTGRPCTRAR